MLSPQELDVLGLVATGLTNADIGCALYIDEATVKSHLLRVFAKLEVANRTRAVMRGIELGLIETPPRLTDRRRSLEAYAMLRQGRVASS